jgi:hypothetical protein
MNLITEYIPLHEIDNYRRNGWDVTPLMGNHGRYGALASKSNTGWVRVGYLARRFWNMWRAA